MRWSRSLQGCRATGGGDDLQGFDECDTFLQNTGNHIRDYTVYRLE
jgi:hypothetical protein